jgi:hypothetical protein
MRPCISFLCIPVAVFIAAGIVKPRRREPTRSKAVLAANILSLEVGDYTAS